MSAWLVWTALGMYPMNPASGEYVFGYPLVKEALVRLPNGKKLSISVQQAKGGKEAGIQRIMLNGKSLKTSVKHEDLLKGGRLEYFLTE
jgi:putative alpha-1,2-mannosidase